MDFKSSNVKQTLKIRYKSNDHKFTSLEESRQLRAIQEQKKSRKSIMTPRISLLPGLNSYPEEEEKKDSAVVDENADIICLNSPAVCRTRRSVKRKFGESISCRSTVSCNNTALLQYYRKNTTEWAEKVAQLKEKKVENLKTGVHKARVLADKMHGITARLKETEHPGLAESNQSIRNLAKCREEAVKRREKGLEDAIKDARIARKLADKMRADESGKK